MVLPGRNVDMYRWNISAALIFVCAGNRISVKFIPKWILIFLCRSPIGFSGFKVKS